MSLEDPILTEITLGITLEPPLLANQVSTELFLPPSKPASSSSSVKPAGPSGARPITSERRTVVNQEKSTQEPNVIGAKGMVTLPASARL